MRKPLESSLRESKTISQQHQYQHRPVGSVPALILVFPHRTTTMPKRLRLIRDRRNLTLLRKIVSSFQKRAVPIIPTNHLLPRKRGLPQENSVVVVVRPRLMTILSWYKLTGRHLGTTTLTTFWTTQRGTRNGNVGMHHQVRIRNEQRRWLQKMDKKSSKWNCWLEHSICIVVWIDARSLCDDSREEMRHTLLHTCIYPIPPPCTSCPTASLLSCMHLYRHRIIFHALLVDQYRPCCACSLVLPLTL